MSTADRMPFWKTPLGWACAGLAAVAAYFLATGHVAHVLSVLARLLLLACPLAHLFLHRGHGRGRHGHERAATAAHDP